MELRYPLMDEADGGDGDKTSGGGGDKGEKDDKGTAAVAELQTQIGVLTKAVTLMAQGQSETQEHVRAFAEAAALHKVDEEKDRKPASSADNLFDGVDLDQLDRREYGTLLLTKFMNQIKTHMDSAVKPITDRINTVETTLTSDIGSRQVGDALKSNADLYEWKDELAAILKDAPGMKLTRALVIARSENPEKAKAMVKKYPPAESKDKNVTYLSMTPTSRTSASDPKKGRMKFNEAADRAFDDMLASLGATDFSQLTGTR